MASASWGAPKIREPLRRKLPDVACPAISTVHAVLDRHHLVKHRRRRVRHAALYAPSPRGYEGHRLAPVDSNVLGRDNTMATSSPILGERVRPSLELAVRLRRMEL